MKNSDNKDPILLSDEQIREFIANGYIVLQPDVPDQLHESIRRNLKFVFDEEFNYGNNILPRVPEMHHILNSPQVRGALISLLGENYIEHPHRHCHTVAPFSPGSEQITLAGNCHQDSYSPLGRPRQHYVRYARLMYYPQDTPIELGPTHVIPGTQFNKALGDEDKARTIPVAGKAGTVSLTHFDIGHAAGINRVNLRRYMIKFIYVRAQEPTAPSWNCQSLQWRDPRDMRAPYHVDLAWSHVWDWMCGKRDRYDSFRRRQAKPANGDLSRFIAELAPERDINARVGSASAVAAHGDDGADAIPALVRMLNIDDEAVRVAAIYALGAVGPKAVDPLIELLKEAGCRDQGQSDMPSWSENAILMDDTAHALAAVGTPAVPALTKALSDNNEWVRINAAFALGELDSNAAEAVPSLTQSLDDGSHRVVRTATDSLGSIGKNVPVFIAALSRLLEENRPGWDQVLLRDWTAGDQVRVNASMAFARLGAGAADAEDVLIRALDDPCGHVAAFAMDALQRIGSPAATKAILKYLQAHRWDDNITKERLY